MMGMDLSQFEEQTKKAWIEAAEKALKGASLDSINWKVDQHITLDPIYTRSEIRPTNAHISSKENNDWWIGEQYNGSDAAGTNQSLLMALSNGLDSPTIKDVTDFDKLLHDVRTDFIYPVFERSSAQAYIEWLKVHFENYSNQSGGFVCLDNDDAIDDTTKVNLLSVQNELPRYYHTQLDLSFDVLNLAESLGTQLKRLQDRIGTLLDHGISPRIRCIMHSQPHYLKMIGSIRAFKMMVAQVLRSYDLNLDAVLMEMAIHSVAEDSKQAMIGATSEAMAAVLGGVDRLEISAEGMLMDEHPDVVRRMCRNIQHLMKMESGLHVQPDPLSGSYMIEKLTRVLSEDGWLYFQKLC